MTDDKPIRIVRTPHSKDRPYFSMARATAQDKDISYEALGLLTYLLSKPDSWEINVKDVAKRSTEYKAYKILRELRKAGYVKLEKERGAGRFSQWVYQVFETCQLLEFQQLENQLIEIQHTQRIEKELDSTEKHTTRKREKVSKPDTIPAALMNPMKDAIALAFGWDWKSMTGQEKGIIQSTAKDLCTANFEPERVGSFHAWCKAKFTHFTPKAMSSHLSEYRLTRLDQSTELKRDKDGLTTLERVHLQHMEVTGEQC